MDEVKERLITEEKEFIEVMDSKVRVGLTQEAKEHLGEIVYIELPKVGKVVQKDESIALLETSKSAIDLAAPYAGVVLAVNDALVDPKLCNTKNDTWLYELKIE